MAFNNENAARMVFDLETMGDAAVLSLLEPPSAPSNYKDAEKIAAYIAQAQREQVERCGLHPDTARIVALGTWTEGGTPTVTTCASEADERRALDAFWQVAEWHQLVGFNCVAFDVPVLVRRSQLLGVRMPVLEVDKYRHRGIDDLFQRLSFNGLIQGKSLKFYSQRFGLDVPADDEDGSAIARLVADGDWEAVAYHCRLDVVRTGKLAARLGYFNVTAADLQPAGVL